MTTPTTTASRLGSVPVGTTVKLAVARVTFYCESDTMALPAGTEVTIRQRVGGIVQAATGTGSIVLLADSTLVEA